MINNVEATSYEPSFFHAASHGRHGDFHATGIPPSSSGLHSVRCCPRSRQRPSSFSPPLPPSTVVARNHVGYRGRHVDSVPFNPLFGAPFIPPPSLPVPSVLFSCFCDLCFHLSFFHLCFYLSFFLTFSKSTLVCVEVCDLCFYLSFFLSSTYLFQVYSGLRGSVSFVFTFLSFFFFSSYLFQVYSGLRGSVFTFLSFFSFSS